MEFTRLERQSSQLLVEIKLSQDVAYSEKNLDLWLERKRGGDNILAAELVVAHKQGQREALRVPLEAPCDIEHLASKVDLASQTMKVTMKLKPLKYDHSLHARSDSRVDTDSESMHTADSDIDSGISISTQNISPKNVSAAATGVDLGAVPATPRQSGDDEEPPSVQLEDSSVASSDDSETIIVQEPGINTEKVQGGGIAEEKEELEEGNGETGEETSIQKKKKKKKKKSGNNAAVEGSQETAGGNDDEASVQEAPVPAGDDQKNVKAKEKEDQPDSARAPPSSVAKEDTLILQPPAAKARSDLTKKAARHPLAGPFISQGLAKERSKGKGEDAWLLKPECSWSIVHSESQHMEEKQEQRQEQEENPGVETTVSAWGIFDGHGGKQVATYASNAMLKEIMAAAEEPCVPVLAGPPVDKTNIPSIDLPSVPASRVEEEEEEEAKEEYYLQAELARRLPTALTQAFIQCNAEAQRRFKSGGGTTATVAMAVGWELIVANVGDSLAFLDTGAEVLAISGNHRLEDSKSEVERILSTGGEVATSTVDGKPAGPIRVWPGGLAMSRSIGDVDAGERVCAQPEVCQVTIPYEGARLLMASDGLWDALHPKTAAHHVRNLTAEAAAHRLLHLAINKDHLKDDVTVVVVDFMPREEDNVPPVLNLPKSANYGGNKGGKHKGGSGSSGDKLAHVWHPLKDEGTHRVDYIAAGHDRRMKMLAAIRAAEEEKMAEENLRAEREAEIAAQRAVEAGQSLQGASGLYAELAHLTLTPEQIAAAFKVETAKKKAKEEKAAKRAKEAEEGWEAVPSSHGGLQGGNKQQQKQQNAKGKGSKVEKQQQQQRPVKGNQLSVEQIPPAAEGPTGSKVLTVKKKPPSKNSKGRKEPAGGGGGGASGAAQPPPPAPAVVKKMVVPHLPPPQLVPTSVLLSTGPPRPPPPPVAAAPSAGAPAEGGDATDADAKRKKARVRRNKPNENTDTDSASQVTL